MMNWASNVKVLNRHRSMLADKKRTGSYQRAISQTVRAGDAVLDLGSGTGILAFLACQAGSRRVYAVEVGEVVELAKQVLVKNDLQDRVIFLNDLSYRVDLPERVDVLVTETMGNFGLEEGLLALVIDARERFLKENGAIIPQSVELFIVPVEVPEAYQRIDTWTSDLYGVDFSPIRPFATNNLHSVRLEQEAFLGDPASLARIQLSEVQAPDLRREVSLVTKRRGTLHGLGGWFTAELSKDVLLSNAPPLMTPSWAHVFFPLEHPVPLEEGDRLNITVSTYDGAEWRWQVEVDRQLDSGGALPKRKAQFDHSTFWGFPLSPDHLRMGSSSYAPKLSRRGEAELFLLEFFNGEKTISEIEKEFLHRYSDVFRSVQEASIFVREVVGRWGC